MAENVKDGESKDDSSAKNDSGVQSSIKSLLDFCASRQVDVPEELKRSLLGQQNDGSAAVDANNTNSMTILDSFLSEKDGIHAEFDEGELMKQFRKAMEDIKFSSPDYDLRVINGKYTVTSHYKDYDPQNANDDNPQEDDAEAPHKKTKKPRIETVATVSFISTFFKGLVYRMKTGSSPRRSETKVLLQDVNLQFKSGKMYLVLGAPGAGKSMLLKYIADTLRIDKDHVREGNVSLNGISSDDPSVYWTNLTAYIDQIDRLHPYLTVQETLDFAWQCRSGGTHAKFHLHDTSDSEVMAKMKEMDDENFTVTAIMEGLGLTRVKDTFVGDNDSVRGVSGGEKKRVTVGEMICVGTPVMCCDEISTGLDAATTYDIVKLMGLAGRMTGVVRIISLLQPPPETVALFDELILVDSGRVIYSGPLEEVVPHFNSLGYDLPDRMDTADWLQALTSKEGKTFLRDPDGKPYTAEEFREKFDETDRAKKVKEVLSQPFPEEEKSELFMKFATTHYANSALRSFRLLSKRELLLWWRDKYQLKMRIVQDLLMGIVAGTVFWQQGSNPQSISGILYQNMFFMAIGAMLKIPTQFPLRGIFYKHQDANFFPTWAYVSGRSLAGVPTAMIDGILFGTIIYWFVGMAGPQNGATMANYFVFVLTMMVISLTAGLVFSIFSAVVKDKPTAQACMSITVLILILFSGFTVQPDTIPNYWIWAYWINMFAWLLRTLNVNEFQSPKWAEVQENGLTAGENILVQFGLLLNGEPFTYSWVWYGLIFAVGISFMSVFVSVFFLNKWRYETGKPLDAPDREEEEVDTSVVEIPFQKVNLTFVDMHYTVTTSTSNEKLELLKGIDGFVEAGKMTALMGSSGAGKTTLMDVLALRKSSGEITGVVCLNGHPQSSRSFRRCTGYVEQFDEQQPQLTIRETIDFSAKLRLDQKDPAVTPESTEAFINQTLDMLELTDIQDLQVGSDLSGGLSFEQKKRLSIGVEVVANPSILFLDEPTSGLDARSASIVMRGLKRIAETRRAVCATIHQPSIAIFNSFDSLLLLKRGGEVVYFGELGTRSSDLITYLERFDATPKIQPGENPATWMLTSIGAGSAGGGQMFDYAGAYAVSKLHEDNLAKIKEFCAAASDENLVAFSTKYSTKPRTQSREVLKRMLKIYWRSPNYNLVRLFVSLIMALLFGSVYVSQRVPTNESEMNSRVTSIYISFLFLAVNAYNTVLAVFEVIRNMYYRHKANLMYNPWAVVSALTLAELPFILLAATIFVIPFYFMLGFALNAAKFFLYYLVMFLCIGLFTFLGQMMVSCFRDSVTAQGFGGLTISLTAMFAGVLIRPQDIPSFWFWAYYVFPGHYILESWLVTQIYNDETPIEASPGSGFWEYLGCEESPCYGTTEQWIYVSFGGIFVIENVKWNIIYLVGVTFAVRMITLWALLRLDFLTK